ncbi:MAG TPA: TraR/DksA C4-type zinc finger protein, partial [Ornithinibacter sp.]|nr:TraR/DksA C4-type zinc finger protein [Ornithinibacter sp.]
SAPATKAAPVKKSAPATKAAPVKKSASAATAATKAAPAKTSAPVKKSSPAKTSAPAGTATMPAPAKAATRAAVAGTAQANKTAPAKKSAPGRTSAPRRKPTGASSAAALVVREDESPWTAKELREVRAELERDIEQLRTELQHAQSDLVDLMRDSGDGAGDDQADAGAKTYEREQEISLANNAREMLEQNEHALERLDNGTYGICESCGNPIGKLRLQAAPRATLCMPCKMKQERR